MSAPSPSMWDQRFAAQPDCYGVQPNQWVEACAGQLAAVSDVLCLAEGQGRNALWLASRRHRVTAVDLSPVGLEQCRERAATLGLSIATVVADLETWRAPPSSFDVVVLTFAHLPPHVRETAHRMAAESLRPGGLVVLEAFSKAQLGLTSGGPKDPALLQSVEELAADFAALEILALEELATTLNEGPLHQGPARVVRLLARR